MVRARPRWKHVDLAINKDHQAGQQELRDLLVALSGRQSGTEEDRNIYKQFSPDFFDLIVVDECHRGSADEDSAWREILSLLRQRHPDRPDRNTQGDRETSPTADYFGEPVYTYSLRQGIEDGYLAPYKVIRVDLDKDAFGWRPTEGMTRQAGQRHRRPRLHRR